MATAPAKDQGLEERLNALERWSEGVNVKISMLEKLEPKIETVKVEVYNIKGTQKLAIGALIAIQFLATYLIALFKGFKS